MNTKVVMPSCLLMLSWVILASARHLQPSSEDLMADMLVLVNTSKTERHMDTRSVEEGSGYGDLIPIQPISSILMERMEQAPALESQIEIEHKDEDFDSYNKEPMNTELQDDEKIAKTFQDEGSGDNEKGLEGIDMLKDLDNIHNSNEETNPNSEVDTIINPTEETFKRIVETTDVPTNSTLEIDESSKAQIVPADINEKMISIVPEGAENVVEPNEGDQKLEQTERHDLVTKEDIIYEPDIENVDHDIIAEIPEKEKIKEAENTTASVLSEGVIEKHPEDIEVVSTVITPEEEPESSTAIYIEESSLEITSIIPPNIPEESPTDSSIDPTHTVIVEQSSTDIPVTTLESIILSQATSEATILPDVEITSQESATEIATEIPIIIPPSPVPILISTTTIGSTTEEATDISVNNKEKESAEISTTSDPHIDDVVTVPSSLEPNLENGIDIVKASLQIPQEERNDNSKTLQQSSAFKSLSLYVIAGILAIILIAIVIAFTMRYRHRGNLRMKVDNRSEKDTENGILGNGKYQEDSDENNIKNNEITPLVIKNSSQINKFEKSPNFSSQKNINTAVNEKNIEKDNVLKSNQTIIEDEDDAKKCIEDEVDEQKKKSLEDSKQLTPEKVVVHTRIDLDSIPKKPIIVHRNGHSYHAVPGGETET